MPIIFDQKKEEANSINKKKLKLVYNFQSKGQNNRRQKKLGQTQYRSTKLPLKWYQFLHVNSKQHSFLQS